MSNAKSIAFVLNGLYVGGAEKFGISLANKFAENGYNSCIVLFKNIPSPLQQEIDSRVEIIYINRTTKFNFILHKQFDAEIAKRGISKVIIIGLLPLFLSRIFSFNRNKHIDYFLSLHSTVPASFKIYLQNLMFLRLAHKNDKVLFICNNQREFYSRSYYFNPSAFEVIYNGVDINYFKPGNSNGTHNKREAQQIGSNEKIILLVATLRKEKGHAFAIMSLKELHTKNPERKDTHLVFIGGGEDSYIVALKELSKKLAVEKFVHFEGNQKDVRAYYEVADLFTLTSYKVETFSIAALEAMCYGLPLSLTNIGGASEMVFEGMNGLLSNAKDPTSIATTWAKLLEAKLDKQAIREVAVNNFSLEKMFAKYSEAIFQ